MKSPQIMLLAASCAMLGACTLRSASVNVDERPVYDDRPVVVYDAPPPPQPDRVVIVQEAPPEPLVVIRQAPPPLYVERIPPRPRGEVVWISGYWVAQRDRWVWVGGRWEAPPRRGAVWVEPRYEQRGTEFHFSAGFWK